MMQNSSTTMLKLFSGIVSCLIRERECVCVCVIVHLSDELWKILWSIFMKFCWVCVWSLGNWSSLNNMLQEEVVQGGINTHNRSRPWLQLIILEFQGYMSSSLLMRGRLLDLFLEWWLVRKKQRISSSRHWSGGFALEIEDLSSGFVLFCWVFLFSGLGWNSWVWLKIWVRLDFDFWFFWFSFVVVVVVCVCVCVFLNSARRIPDFSGIR
jgi:hypothetical protein